MFYLKKWTKCGRSYNPKECLNAIACEFVFWRKMKQHYGPSSYSVRCSYIKSRALEILLKANQLKRKIYFLTKKPVKLALRLGPMWVGAQFVTKNRGGKKRKLKQFCKMKVSPTWNKVKFFVKNGTSVQIVSSIPFFSFQFYLSNSSVAKCTKLDSLHEDERSQLTNERFIIVKPMKVNRLLQKQSERRTKLIKVFHFDFWVSIVYLFANSSEQQTKRKRNR